MIPRVAASDEMARESLLRRRGWFTKHKQIYARSWTRTNIEMDNQREIGRHALITRDGDGLFDILKMFLILYQLPNTRWITTVHELKMRRGSSSPVHQFTEPNAAQQTHLEPNGVSYHMYLSHQNIPRSIASQGALPRNRRHLQALPPLGLLLVDHEKKQNSWKTKKKCWVPSL